MSHLTHGATVLVGDIGGTNARLQLRQLSPAATTSTSRGGGASKRVLYAATLKREKYARFEDALRTFLESAVTTPPTTTSEAAATAAAVNIKMPSRACFAVAGIIQNNRCDMTNSPWVIDGNALRDSFDIDSVAVINDFEAVGHGVAALMQQEDEDEHQKKEDAICDAEIVSLLRGVPVKGGPVLVLGPGTGLGVSQLFYDAESSRYKVMASEGGHAEFAPRTQEQREVQAWIQQKLGYCEIESILSGNGLERLYAFFSGNEIDAASVSGAALSIIQPESSTITDEKVDVVAATKAARLFLSILGASAGNISLTTFARGGVFIAGGITSKLFAVAEKYQDIEEGFLHRECRYYDVLAKMPLTVIREEYDIGLRGAMHYITNLV